ncbi:MAG: hypothetical protein ACM3S4_03665 [Burkholderiales bacterium]
MRRKNKLEGPDDPEVNPYDFYSGVSIGSQTECTGMVPTPPLDDAQVDGYHDIHSIPQQKGTGAMKMKDAKEQKKKSSRPRT